MRRAGLSTFLAAVFRLASLLCVLSEPLGRSEAGFVAPAIRRGAGKSLQLGKGEFCVLSEPLGRSEAGFVAPAIRRGAGKSLQLGKGEFCSVSSLGVQACGRRAAKKMPLTRRSAKQQSDHEEGDGARDVDSAAVQEREYLKADGTKGTYIRPKGSTGIVDASVGSSMGSASRLELAVRSARVFYAATRLFSDYKLVQYRSDRCPEDDEDASNAIWDAAHERNSRFLYRKFVGLEGLWVKLGQYLSSRADFMPEPFIEHLGKCQDSIPHREWPSVKAQIERELGKPIDEIFSSVGEKPIACASIAQVHKAVLIDGTHVVIKVQHDNVGRRLLQDLKNLETIGNVVRWLEPDFDFSPVIREWAGEVPNELDFFHEGDSLAKVEQNLMPSTPAFGADPASPLSFDVSFPHVIPGLISKKVMVMTFIDGVKVDDMDALKSIGADASEIVRDVTRAYAHQIFVDGFYSADPHPGNIMVSRSTGKAVLLDFGLTKQIDDTIRLSFAKLLVAAAEKDVQGILESLEGVGLRLRTDVPFDGALLVSYFFRDAKPREEAVQETVERRSANARRREERSGGVYAGDTVDVTLRGAVFGTRKTRKGKVIKAGKEMVTVEMTDGHVKSVPRADVKAVSARSAIDAWPDAFIFFDRVLQLLRGLTAKLQVTSSYLEVMTPFASKALFEAERAKGLVEPAAAAPSVLGKDATPGSQVLKLVQDLLESGEMLGCQVSVARHGEELIDLAGGLLSPYSRARVENDSLFNCFSVTKGLAAAAVWSLVSRGKIDVHAPVANYWPKFSGHGKEGITVEHVLTHRAGLHMAGIQEMMRDPYTACDSDAMLRILEEAEADGVPGQGDAKYHFLTFGWLVEGIVRGATGGISLSDYVASEIAPIVGAQDELLVGLGEGGTKTHKERLATLVLSKSQQFMTEPPPEASKARKNKTDENAQRPHTGPSLLLNPTFFNNPRIREASIPAANGHFSARGLCKLYSVLEKEARQGGSTGGLMEGGDWAEHIKNGSGRGFGGMAKDSSIQGGNAKFVGGFTVYPREEGDSEMPCFGHGGVGGSIAFCDPSNGLSIAVTLNRLTMQTSSTSGRIVAKVYETLGLPAPLQFADGDVLNRGNNQAVVDAEVVLAT